MAMAETMWYKRSEQASRCMVFSKFARVYNIIVYDQNDTRERHNIASDSAH